MRFLVILMLFSVHASYAQSTANYTENDDINRRLEKLEIENKILAQQQLRYPSADITAPNESISTDDDAGYYSSVLNFVSLNKAATEIEKVIHDAAGGGTGLQVALVSGESMVEFDALYVLTRSKAKSLLQEFCRINEVSVDPGNSEYLVKIPQTVNIDETDWSCDVDSHIWEISTKPAKTTDIKSFTLAIMALPGVISFGAQLMSYFNVERKIHGVETSIGQSAVDAAVLHALINSDNGNGKNNWKVLSLEYHKNTQSNLMKLLERMNQESLKTSNKLFELRDFLGKVTSEIALESKKTVDFEKLRKDETDPANFPKLDKDISDSKERSRKLSDVQSVVNLLISRGDTLQSGLGTLIAALEKTGTDGTSPNLLHRLMKVEKYRQADWGLRVTLENNGGEMHISDSLWTRAKVSHLGGVTLSYRLIDFSIGEIKTSGLVSRFAGDAYKVVDGPTALTK